MAYKCSQYAQKVGDHIRVVLIQDYISSSVEQKREPRTVFHSVREVNV